MGHSAGAKVEGGTLLRGQMDRKTRVLGHSDGEGAPVWEHSTGCRGHLYPGNLISRGSGTLSWGNPFMGAVC